MKNNGISSLMRKNALARETGETKSDKRNCRFHAEIAFCRDTGGYYWVGMKTGAGSTCRLCDRQR